MALTFNARRIAQLGLGGVITAGAASAAYQTLKERADRRRFPPLGRMIDVNGRRVHVWAEGEGDPTIVVVPGMSSSGIHWAHIQRALAPDHRVVLYDRAGVGWSQAAPWWQWRSSSRIADELHGVLTAADERGPYLLVGHSLGGEVVRLFAARHREDVAGMVLVDAPSENNEWLVKELGGWQYGPLRWWGDAVTTLLTPRGLTRLRVQLGLDTSFHDRARKKVPADLVETEVFTELTTGVRRADVMERIVRSSATLRHERRHFGDMPLVVISKSDAQAPGTYGYDYGTPEMRARVAPVWARIQADLASLSHNSKLVVAERAGHNVQWDEPELIIDATAEMCVALAKEEV